MKALHIHVHLDRELLADPNGSIHIHLKPDGRGPGRKGRRTGKKPRRKTPPPKVGLEASGYPVMAERSGMPVAACAPMASGIVAKPQLAREQRIRSKMYRLDVVPSPEGGDLKSHSQLYSAHEAGLSVVLELATGNQVNPIVWESCDPASQRGLWRLSVREDYGRLLGIVTHARDPRAIWVVSDWTPRGTLILEPAEPQHYPRLMLTPVAAFQR